MSFSYYTIIMPRYRHRVWDYCVVLRFSGVLWVMEITCGLDSHRFSIEYGIGIEIQSSQKPGVRVSKNACGSNRQSASDVWNAATTTCHGNAVKADMQLQRFYTSFTLDLASPH